MKKLSQITVVFFVILMLLPGIVTTNANPADSDAIPISTSAGNAVESGSTPSFAKFQGDGCLEIFMAWTDTVFASMAYAPGSNERIAKQIVAAGLFTALMFCIMQ